GDIGGARPTLSAAMNFVKNTKALIIDMRYNGGGSPDMVSAVESYFFKEKTHLIDLISTLDKDVKKIYSDPASTGGLYLDMPLYILCSNRTASGGEDFTYTMQNLRQAKVIGEVTAGAANGSVPDEL